MFSSFRKCSISSKFCVFHLPYHLDCLRVPPRLKTTDPNSAARHFGDAVNKTVWRRVELLKVLRANPERRGWQLSGTRNCGGGHALVACVCFVCAPKADNVGSFEYFSPISVTHPFYLEILNGRHIAACGKKTVFFARTRPMTHTQSCKHARSSYWN